MLAVGGDRTRWGTFRFKAGATKDDVLFCVEGFNSVNMRYELYHTHVRTAYDFDPMYALCRLRLPGSANSRALQPPRSVIDTCYVSVSPRSRHGTGPWGGVAFGVSVIAPFSLPCFRQTLFDQHSSVTAVIVVGDATASKRSCVRKK